MEWQRSANELWRTYSADSNNLGSRCTEWRAGDGDGLQSRAWWRTLERVDVDHNGTEPCSINHGAESDGCAGRRKRIRSDDHGKQLRAGSVCEVQRSGSNADIGHTDADRGYDSC